MRFGALVAIDIADAAVVIVAHIVGVGVDAVPVVVGPVEFADDDAAVGSYCLVLGDAD